MNSRAIIQVLTVKPPGAGEAEGRSAEESESGHEGNNRKKELKPAKHGGDEPNKGEKANTET